MSCRLKQPAHLPHQHVQYIPISLILEPILFIVAPIWFIVACDNQMYMESCHWTEDLIRHFILTRQQIHSPIW